MSQVILIRSVYQGLALPVHNFNVPTGREGVSRKDRGVQTARWERREGMSSFPHLHKDTLTAPNQLGMERFKAPEILFNPEQVGLEYAGVHQVIVDSINRVDLDLRKNLFSNIVLSGGSTLCTGFGDRLLNEVKRLAIKDVKIRIYAPPERKYSTWIGGSILAGLATFKKVCYSTPRIQSV
jgi:actin-related protein